MGLGGARARAVVSARASWQPLLDASGVPSAHSSLAADDAILPAMGCSAIAWFGLRSAASAMDRSLDLLRTSAEANSAAALAELRAALVHASHAVTVLAPRRSDRVTYALRIAWTAFTGEDERSPSLASLAPFSSPLVVREVETVLRERGFSATPRWSDASSVRLATGHLRSRVLDPELFEATVRFLWDGEGHDDVVADDVIACAETVAAVVERGLVLWGTRSAAAQPVQQEPEVGSSTLFSRAEAPAVDAYAPTLSTGRRRRSS